MVPHLDTTAALSSDGGAGPAFIIGLLSVNDKRGSNRGNDKRSYYSCNGGGTSLAFVVGLLDVDCKRGGNRGIVAVAGCWQRRRHRPGVCCRPVGVKVKDKMGSWSATGGNRRALPARTPGRCAIEIGAMVFGDRCAGSSRMVSRFPL